MDYSKPWIDEAQQAWNEDLEKEHELNWDNLIQFVTSLENHEPKQDTDRN